MPDTPTVDDFIHAYPALESRKSLDNYMKGVGNDYNQFFHFDAVSDHTTHWVVRPNNDTVYSLSWIDVSGGPVEICLPTLEPGDERYLSLMMIDYEHFQIDTAVHPDRPIVLAALDDPIGESEDYLLFRTYTNLVFAAARTEWLPSDDGNTQVKRYQGRMTIRRLGGGALAGPQVDPVFPEEVEAQGLAAIQEAAPDYNFEQCFRTREDGLDDMPRAVGVYLGQWGQQLKYAYAEYHDLDQAGEPLSGAHEYRITLDAEGVPFDHFWSVTVYDEKGYMIAPVGEDPHRYKHGNRNTTPEEDGTLELYFSSRRDTLRKNSVATGSGLWNYTIRIYGPHSEVIDGGWLFPKASKLGS